MKLQKVSQSMSPFAGIFFVHEEFSKCGLLRLIDRQLGKRNNWGSVTENCSERGLRYSFVEEK